MLGWLRQIPEELLRTRLPRYFNYIWSLINSGQFAAVEDCLRYLDETAKDDHHLQGRIAAVRASVASAKDDSTQAETQARKALSLLTPDGEGTHRPENDGSLAVTCYILGRINMQRGRITEAEPLLRQSLRFFGEAGSTSNTIHPLTILGNVASARGKLHEAVRLYQKAIEVGKGDPATALAHLWLGHVFYEWNDLEAAASCLEQATRLSQLLGSASSTVLMTAYLHLARTRMAMGDIAEAKRAMENSDSVLSEIPSDRARNRAFHAAIALMQGDTDCALRWVSDLSEREVSRPFDLPTPAIRLFWSQKGKAIARNVAKAAYDLYAPQGLESTLISLRTAQALGLANGPVEAVGFLAEAVASARPEGFTRTFVDWGMEYAPLLKTLITRKVEAEYSRRLLDMIEAEESLRKAKRGEIPASSSTTSILSEREIEVLALVSKGLSNRQIAERLFVTPGTIKVHIHNVAEKLNAKNRTEAVTRAAS